MAGNLTELFRNIPDIVLITDAYGYVLDWNRRPPFEGMRKGLRLSRFIPDALETPEGELRLGGRIYRRQTSLVRDGKKTVGYTVVLSDITEEMRLTSERQQRKEELDLLVQELRQKNAELEDYALQVKTLSEYEEQLRIARMIHDQEGHAITELHTISEMCLKLRDSDPERFRELLAEGRRICAASREEGKKKEYGSAAELLEYFSATSSFPVEVQISGEEPAFLKSLYGLIERICREAYHNTLAHSLADRMEVELRMNDEEAVFQIRDNGSFRGPFERGFGLSTMEDQVRLSGGSVEFTAEEGKGFAVTAVWRAENGSEI